MLYQTLAQLRTNLRLLTDTAGTSALARHPDVNLNDYINRGFAALYRILKTAMPDQRFLGSWIINTQQGVQLYPLPNDFDHLISIDLTANGRKAWLIAYEMHERPALTDPSMSYTGIPLSYRLHGANQIEYLPTPQGTYPSQLWYVPSAQQMAVDGDQIDTIDRLDDFVLAYAGRLIAIRDKEWQLVAALQQTMDQLRGDVEMAGRARDKNSPGRVIDESQADRWGRRIVIPRRWR